jgi:hypothetical protein
MRVYSSSHVSNVSGANAARGANGVNSRFSLPHMMPPQTSGATGISALANLDALMALQEVDDPVERKKRAVKRGHNILDSLGQLKASMLAGKVSSADLTRIVEHLRTRAPSPDPQLDDILAQIELRAEVELAKLGMNR